MYNTVNKGIDCDVCSCEHNSNGKNCKLTTVKITKDCTNCTCCGSFMHKQDC